MYNEKYLKIKIESYNNKININFHDNGMPKEVSCCVCLSVALIDSVSKTDKNIFHQYFWKIANIL